MKEVILFFLFVLLSCEDSQVDQDSTTATGLENKIKALKDNEDHIKAKKKDIDQQLKKEGLSDFERERLKQEQERLRIDQERLQAEQIERERTLREQREREQRVEAQRKQFCNEWFRNVEFQCNRQVSRALQDVADRAVQGCSRFGSCTEEYNNRLATRSGDYLRCVQREIARSRPLQCPISEQ